MAWIGTKKRKSQVKDQQQDGAAPGFAELLDKPKAEAQQPAELIASELTLCQLSYNTNVLLQQTLSQKLETDREILAALKLILEEIQMLTAEVREVNKQ